MLETISASCAKGHCDCEKLISCLFKGIIDEGTNKSSNQLLLHMLALKHLLDGKRSFS